MTGSGEERRFVVELTETQLNAIYAAFARHEEVCDVVDEGAPTVPASIAGR
ncbi:hypothetical protein [Leifsonia xyli]|uniref:hypothetical protein n=1 Tax=Leifsonia xyli TaxID=1575 RepID=UPI000304A3E7|nr:hypothetical protein [Leifsonia xyli]